MMGRVRCTLLLMIALLGLLTFFFMDTKTGTSSDGPINIVLVTPLSPHSTQHHIVTKSNGIPPKTQNIVKAQTSGVKVIYGATKLWQSLHWSDLLDLSGCEYQNCVSANSTKFIDLEYADVVVFAERLVTRLPKLPWTSRQRQLWVMMSYESSGYSFNHFKPQYNGNFNATMLYRRDATIYYPWGKTLQGKTNLSVRNFAVNKTKGAFAYVSNCGSVHYDRLKLMKELQKYIDIDIFSETCKGNEKPPCPRLPKGSNPTCEIDAHKPYRFYLSFENSLCEDYITEKFWDRLLSPGYFIPIAMGGLTIDDYTDVAPPNSFIHLYNFTSVQALGKYLRYLMHNNTAYNEYHEWRYNYYIDTNRGMAGCELCRLANEKPSMPADKKITNWFNNPKRCRKMKLSSRGIFSF